MPAPFSRRSFLAASAGLVVAAACGSGDEAPSAGAPSTTTASVSRADSLNVVLASFLPVAGVDQRVAFGVLRGQEPVGEDVDVRAAISTGSAGGTVETVTATRHDEGIASRPFFTVTHRFPAPGTYRLGVIAGGQRALAAFEVADPATVEVPIPGRPLPAVASSTTSDLRGIEVLCSADPVCPLHDVTVAAALEERRPLAVMVSTPALCKSAICGPVLDMLLEELPAHPQVRGLHLEPFADRAGRKLAPHLEPFALVNEPALFLAGSDGVVRTWFDGPFDKGELREALAALTA